MKLDPVHDLQKVTRTLLHAFSFPGTQGDLSEQADKLDFKLPFSAVCALTALALLDTETTFAFLGEESGPCTEVLVQLTSARPVAVGEAAFVLVPCTDDEFLSRAFDEARLGTLLDPHLGATILAGVPDLRDGDLRLLRGPGIRDSIQVVLPLGKLGLAARARAVREFPLGVDLILYDARGLVLALPRTTHVEVV